MNMQKNVFKLLLLISIFSFSSSVFAEVDKDRFIVCNDYPTYDSSGFTGVTDFTLTPQSLVNSCYEYASQPSDALFVISPSREQLDIVYLYGSYSVAPLLYTVDFSTSYNGYDTSGGYTYFDQSNAVPDGYYLAYYSLSSSFSYSDVIPVYVSDGLFYLSLSDIPSTSSSSLPVEKQVTYLDWITVNLVVIFLFSLLVGGIFISPWFVNAKRYIKNV